MRAAAIYEMPLKACTCRMDYVVCEMNDLATESSTLRVGGFQDADMILLVHDHQIHYGLGKLSRPRTRDQSLTIGTKIVRSSLNWAKRPTRMGSGTCGSDAGSENPQIIPLRNSGGHKQCRRQRRSSGQSFQLMTGHSIHRTIHMMLYLSSDYC